MQRRDFMTRGLGMLALAGAGSMAMAEAAGALPASAQGFASLLQDQFLIYDSARGVPVRLVKVKQAPATPGLQQFSLGFEGERAGALPSGTYEVQHPAIGTTRLFLQADSHGQSVRYRADFCLLA